ncbi:MAG: PilZ domain-containing protein [Candidatus Omnitrophota bacterium]
MASLENRKFLRANIALKVEYESLSPPGCQGAAYSKDISVLGMNLIMPDEVARGTRLGLRIFLDEEVPPVAAKGKIVWQRRCDYLPQSNRRYYISGIQFEDMPSDDAVRASEFVRGYLKSQSEADIKRIIEMTENLKRS